MVAMVAIIGKKDLNLLLQLVHIWPPKSVT